MEYLLIAINLILLIIIFNKISTQKRDNNLFIWATILANDYENILLSKKIITQEDIENTRRHVQSELNLTDKDVTKFMIQIASIDGYYQSAIKLAKESEHEIILKMAYEKKYKNLVQKIRKIQKGNPSYEEDMDEWYFLEEKFK